MSAPFAALDVEAGAAADADSAAYLAAVKKVVEKWQGADGRIPQQAVQELMASIALQHAGPALVLSVEGTPQLNTFVCVIVRVQSSSGSSEWVPALVQANHVQVEYQRASQAGPDWQSFGVAVFAPEIGARRWQLPKAKQHVRGVDLVALDLTDGITQHLWTVMTIVGEQESKATRSAGDALAILKERAQHTVTVPATETIMRKLLRLYTVGPSRGQGERMEEECSAGGWHYNIIDSAQSKPFSKAASPMEHGVLGAHVACVLWSSVACELWCSVALHAQVCCRCAS